MMRDFSNTEKRVCELFAGVGGFRLGLERSGWNITYSNQWEPKKKTQHASDCYVHNFGDKGHTNIDIAEAKYDIPEHDLLVAGFPCQDYSVAATNAKGIKGKKGVLWWDIYFILEKNRPPYVLLENVDRLLRSPSSQRGRDFGVILGCLNNLGYDVEWRVINASDYGFPQRRLRTFIFASRSENKLNDIYRYPDDKNDIIFREGLLSRAFPVKEDGYEKMRLKGIDEGIKIPDDLIVITDEFEYHFYNSGVMVDGAVYSKKIEAEKEDGLLLGDILQDDVEEEYFIPEEDIKDWEYHKGSKDELRNTKTGHKYRYKEGAITFPDRLDRPSRTLITSDGSMRPNRFSHVLKDPRDGRLRILTPVEAERLNGFPDDWTDTGMSKRWRYFCMGNALVVGIIERFGKLLAASLNGNSFLSEISDKKIDQKV
jgi:DNA (cytosine-5)-methyltransferase 1